MTQKDLVHKWGWRKTKGKKEYKGIISYYLKKHYTITEEGNVREEEILDKVGREKKKRQR